MLALGVTLFRTLLQGSILADQWFLIPRLGGLAPPVRICSPAPQGWGAVWVVSS
jgi:hypothetical protein